MPRDHAHDHDHDHDHTEGPLMITPRYPEAHSQYWNPIKALRRETVDSYTGRVLPANQETDMHKQHLIKVALLELPGQSAEQTWTRVITEKAGLDPVHFSRAAESGLHHRDGTRCSACTEGLGERWMCTHCSHGINAGQYAHLDDIICRHHSRWVGPGSGPADQRHVGPEFHVAERQFRRLRRRGQLDVLFYITLRDAFRTCHTSPNDPSDSMTLTDIAIYPLMMLTATALTRPDFLRDLFDPRQSYATAHSLLAAQIQSAAGEGFEQVIRTVWLYLRPTFLSVREHALGKKAYSRRWDHDFPLPDAVIETLAQLERETQPFRNYLDVSGDYELTEENWKAVRVHHLNQPKHPDTKRRADDDFESVCRNGHRITLQVSGFHKFIGPKTDGCRVCTNYLAEPGTNDLQTLYPAIGSELHPEDNNGTSPSEVVPGSSSTHNWRCTKSNHPFPATPYNRVHRDSACPVCLNRQFRPGENDIQTKRPDLGEEWHPTLNLLRPGEVSIGSPDSAWWQCRFGDVWHALIESRAHGHGCPKCGARKLHNGASLAIAHPKIAREWDFEANGLRTPNDVAATSRDAFAWKCAKGHPYTQRVDRRAAGSGCPYCARRKPFPGETDFASEYPLIAVDWDWARNDHVNPGEILPGTTKYWWKCHHQHEQFQSIPHRVKSMGCIECLVELRSGVEADCE